MLAVPDPSAPIRDAYVYGYPLVAGLHEVARFTTTGLGAQPQADFNKFSLATTLAGPADTFVTITNDTLSSTGNIDLSGGPVLLHAPDTGGTYYVVHFIDAWTNNFTHVGRRATTATRPPTARFSTTLTGQRLHCDISYAIHFDQPPPG